MHAVTWTYHITNSEFRYFSIEIFQNDMLIFIGNEKKKSIRKSQNQSIFTSGLKSFGHCALFYLVLMAV